MNDERWEQIKQDEKETLERLEQFLTDCIYNEQLTKFDELPFKKPYSIDCLCKDCAVDYITKHPIKPGAVFIIVPHKYCQSDHEACAGD